jgi:hypothetical protein
MLVTFKSTATESITLFGEHAHALLKLMGATGHIPGALRAEDVPAALSALEKAVERLKAEARSRADTGTDARNGFGSSASSKGSATEGAGKSRQDPSDEEEAPPVSIETRAVPLIALLKRAVAAGAEVMWQAA